MHSLKALPAPLLALIASFKPVFADQDDLSVKIEVTTPVGCTRPSRDGDSISVHYIGTLESTGAEFDQSYKRGQPFTFKLGAHQVIKGWEEGLLDMCPGEGRRLTIPPELAYGKVGRPPVIPGDATLVFETELVDIVGVKQEILEFATTATDADFSIATAPPTPPVEDEKVEDEDSLPDLQGTPLSDSSSDSDEENTCHLLGPFALFVQGALGVLAVLALVIKRWWETPKRPWKVWLFDISKQLFGSAVLHVLNVLGSLFGAGDLNKPAQIAVDSVDAASVAGRESPNPCSFYLLNLGTDTTLGVPVLYLLLKILHVAFSYTPLARPKESIKSGNYGQPAKWTWFLKQCIIYFIGLVGMKLFVFFLFAIFPWLPWVGDWALRWTEGNEAVQIAFVMFIFPLIMNIVQYWIIDSFIMDKDRGNGYQQVQSQDDEEDDDLGGGQDDDETVTAEEDSVHKGSGDSQAPPLKEANPTPIPEYREGAPRRGESSGTVSPQKEAEAKRK